MGKALPTDADSVVERAKQVCELAEGVSPQPPSPPPAKRPLILIKS